MEFMALANHRKQLREEFARYGDRFREEQRKALEDALQRYGVDACEVPPVVWAVFATSLSRVLVMDEAFGITGGHAETLHFVDGWLQQFEGDPPTEATTTHV